MYDFYFHLFIIIFFSDLCRFYSYIQLITRLKHRFIFKQIENIKKKFYIAI